MTTGFTADMKVVDWSFFFCFDTQVGVLFNFFRSSELHTSDHARSISIMQKTTALFPWKTTHCSPAFPQLQV